MPPKILNAYGGYTPTQLKDRSSIPLASNITVQSTYIECVYIDLVLIRNIIGASEWDIGAIAAHANVNRWSWFGPTARSIVSQELVNTVIKDFGSFAGYNPNALTPGWQLGGLAEAETTIIVYPPQNGIGYGQATIITKVCVGELNWIGLGGYWLVLLIHDSSHNIVAWSKIDINTISDNVTISATSDINGGISSANGWYGRIIISSLQALTTRQEAIANILCKLPNTAIFNVNINVLTTLWIETNSFSWGSSETTAKGTIVHTAVNPFVIVSTPSWITTQVMYDGNNIHNSSLFYDGYTLNLIPSVNAGSARSGYVFVSNSTSENPVSIAVYQSAAVVDPTVSVGISDGETFTIGASSGSISANSDQLTFQFSGLDGFSATPTLLSYYILDATNATVKTGALTDVQNHPTASYGGTVTISRNAQNGDVFRVFLGNPV